MKAKKLILEIREVQSKKMTEEEFKQEAAEMFFDVSRFFLKTFSNAGFSHGSPSPYTLGNTVWNTIFYKDFFSLTEDKRFKICLKYLKKIAKQFDLTMITPVNQSSSYDSYVRLDILSRRKFSSLKNDSDNFILLSVRAYPLLKTKNQDEFEIEVDFGRNVRFINFKNALNFFDITDIPASWRTVCNLTLTLKTVTEKISKIIRLTSLE